MKHEKKKRKENHSMANTMQGHREVNQREKSTTQKQKQMK